MIDTMTMLFVVAYFTAVGFLMAWAASNSRTSRMFRLNQAVSRLGYFLTSLTLTLLPFLNGTFQPSLENQPFLAVGLIGSMIVGYYATKAQLWWHESRRSTKG